MSVNGSVERVGAGHFVARKLYDGVVSELFVPTTLNEETDGVQKARTFLKAGIGLAIPYTHPSRLDPHRLAKLWKYNEFAEREVLFPISLHQYTIGAIIPAWPTGLKFHPVITRETIERFKAAQAKQGNEITDRQARIQLGKPAERDYLDVAVDTLAHGGIVCYAPTTTRTPELAMPPGRLRPSDLLFNAAASRGVRFGVLVTAYEINGAEDYQAFRGLNLFKRYTLHTGDAFLDEELVDRLEDFRAERNLPPRRNPFDNTDDWLYQTQLPSLVPPAYRPRNGG